MSGLRGDLARTQIKLDEMAPGSVVIDKYGHAWQSDRIYWYRAYGEEVFSSFELAQSAPIYIAHTEGKPVVKPAPARSAA